ncbi:MAG: hypothetical protein IT385_12075 [Deltaproteobacteria bacterium]|nr:hypothetical protein [Deltaproteobacteria bacterium]
MSRRRKWAMFVGVDEATRDQVVALTRKLNANARGAHEHVTRADVARRALARGLEVLEAETPEPAPEPERRFRVVRGGAS